MRSGPNNGGRTIARAIESLSGKVQVVFIRGNHDWTVDYGRLFPAPAPAPASARC